MVKIWNIKGETESTIVAAQDQAISTNYFINKILNEVDSKCWLFYKHEETIDHLISGCPIWVKSEYLMRHDKVGAHLKYSICKALGTETTDKWYTHTHTHTHTNPYVNMKMFMVLWNQGVHTD
jgi:hypothetical protein